MNISKIESYLTSAEIESAHRCATRLILSLPNKVKMNNNRVLLGYGGGKDSSYTVAWVRYIQHITLTASLTPCTPIIYYATGAVQDLPSAQSNTN